MESLHIIGNYKRFLAFKTLCKDFMSLAKI